jgi:diacylglycerol kinase (ATP)
VASFDRIVVIFNPQSTGEAPRLAEELRADLAGRLPTTVVSPRRPEQ